MRWTGALCVAWLLLGAPSAAQAQLFFGSRPDPDFTIGPLTIRAVVSERPGPVEVQVLWGVTPPPRRRVGDVAQDLYLLWPG
ncbi:MAG TPA: hypothetical protein VFN71_04395, partial [Methylomirabilota bacterium]|nr:hypothetical protein [Methylomirabilota bacterium]